MPSDGFVYFTIVALKIAAFLYKPSVIEVAWNAAWPPNEKPMILFVTSLLFPPDKKLPICVEAITPEAILEATEKRLREEIISNENKETNNV